MPWAAGNCYGHDHGTAMLPLVLLGAGLLVVAYIKGAEAVPFRLAALGALLCGVLVAVFVAYDIADVSRIPTTCFARSTRSVLAQTSTPPSGRT